MRVGLHISDFTWDGGAAELAPKMGAIAQRAEDAGVDRISLHTHIPYGAPLRRAFAERARRLRR